MIGLPSLFIYSHLLPTFQLFPTFSGELFPPSFVPAFNLYLLFDYTISQIPYCRLLEFTGISYPIFNVCEDFDDCFSTFRCIFKSSQQKTPGSSSDLRGPPSSFFEQAYHITKTSVLSCSLLFIYVRTFRIFPFWGGLSSFFEQVYSLILRRYCLQ